MSDQSSEISSPYKSEEQVSNLFSGEDSEIEVPKLKDSSKAKARRCPKLKDSETSQNQRICGPKVEGKPQSERSLKPRISESHSAHAVAIQAQVLGVSAPAPREVQREARGDVVQPRRRCARHVGSGAALALCWTHSDSAFLAAP